VYIHSHDSLEGYLRRVIAVFVMWFAIIAVHLRRFYIMQRQQGGLGTIAGGWNYLLGMPPTVLLLTAAFGVGLYLTVRWISH